MRFDDAWLDVSNKLVWIAYLWRWRNLVFGSLDIMVPDQCSLSKGFICYMIHVRFGYQSSLISSHEITYEYESSSKNKFKYAKKTVTTIQLQLLIDILVIYHSHIEISFIIFHIKAAGIPVQISSADVYFQLSLWTSVISLQ